MILKYSHLFYVHGTQAIVQEKTEYREFKYSYLFKCMKLKQILQGTTEYHAFI